MSTQPENLTPPATFRSAGVLVAAQGAVSLVAAFVLVVRAVSGEGDNAVANGYGTAGWFGVLGLGVGAAGVALILGKRWGGTGNRRTATAASVVWSLLTGSHQTVYGIVLGIVVVAVLVLLFSPPSSQWMAAEYSDVDDEPRL